MPKLRRAELDEAEELVAKARETVDLAVTFRVIGEGGQTRPLLDATGKRRIFGGRWEGWRSAWAPANENELRVHEWTIQEQQLPLLDEPVETIFVALFAGRQAGKTYAAVMAVVLDALRWPGRQSAIVSLNYKASRDPERTFRSLLAAHWGVKRNKTDRSYTFPNGHVVTFLSVEAIETIRGPSLKTVLIDEAAYAKYEAFTTALGCGAAAQWFRILLATTPKRESQWCREVDVTWGKSMPQSRIIRLTTMANPRRNEALIEAIKDSTPADIYDQEFRGLLLPPSDAAYARLFNRNLHIRPPGNLPVAARFGLDRQRGSGNAEVLSLDVTSRWVKQQHGVSGAEYVGGWDFVKEAAVVGKLFQDARTTVEMVGSKEREHRRFRLRLWIIGELVNLNTSTDHHAAAVIEKFGRKIFWITDAMGAHDKSGGRGDEPAGIEILLDAGFAGAEPVASRNPGVRDRVRTVGRALRSSRGRENGWPDVPGEDGWPGGEVRLFLAGENKKPTCPQLVDALENQRMINGKPEKDGKYEHVADALGYLVYAVLPADRAEDARIAAEGVR